jgi:hypothetical protein
MPLSAKSCLTSLVAGLLLSACTMTAPNAEVSRGKMSPAYLPAMRWDHRPEADDWTRATLQALEDDGAVLANLTPADIEVFCPDYADATPDERRAFWAGLLSALAKHESTWNPKAAGGGGKWLGLMQIAPGTARAYDCDLPSGKGLYDGSANLTCAVRIAAKQVARDGAIVADGSGDWAGLARDWAPMRVASKRADMAAWTRAQGYCKA